MFTPIGVANEGLETASCKPSPLGPMSIHPSEECSENISIFEVELSRLQGRVQKSALPLVALKHMTLDQEPKSLTTRPLVTPCVELCHLVRNYGCIL